MSETYISLHILTYCYWCAPFTLIAAILLFMMQYMLLHHNTTFEVLAAKHQWSVEEKAECCRNAGLFYLCVTLSLCLIKFVEEYRVLRWLQQLLYKVWTLCCPWRWRYFKLREEDNDETRRRSKSSGATSHKTSNHVIAYHHVGKAQSSCHARNKNNRERNEKQSNNVPIKSRQWHKEVHKRWTNDESDKCLLAHHTKKTNHIYLFAERKNNHNSINLNTVSDNFNSNNIYESRSSNSNNSTADRESEQEMISAHLYEPYDREVTFCNLNITTTSHVNNTTDNIIANSSDESHNASEEEEDKEEDEAQSESMATLPYFLHNARDVKCKANNIILEKQHKTRYNNTLSFLQSIQSSKVTALDEANMSVKSNYDNNNHANIDINITDNSISNSSTTENSTNNYNERDNIHKSIKLEQMQQQATLQLSSLNPLALTPFELRSSTYTHAKTHTPTRVKFEHKSHEPLINRRWRRGEWCEESNRSNQTYLDKNRNTNCSNNNTSNDMCKIKNEKRNILFSPPSETITKVMISKNKRVKTLKINLTKKK